MGTIASTTFDRHGHTWDLRILQGGASASLDIGVTGLTRTQGSTSATVLSPILPSRLEIQFRDPSSSVLDRLRQNPLSDFEVELDQDGNRWHEGELIESDLGNSAWSDPKVTLRFGDHIKSLGAADQHFRGDGAGDDSADWRWKYVPSGDIYHKMGRVPACVLHTVTNLPVRLYWNYEHSDRKGRSRPEDARMRAMDLARDQHPPPRRFALKRFCRVWGLQCVQHNGKYWLMERAMRGQSSDYAQYSTTGSFGRTDVGSETRKVTLSDADIRSKEKISPRIRRPKYDLFDWGRYRADSSSNDFDPTGLNPQSGPEADVWDYNVDSVDSSNVTFSKSSHTLKRTEPWERPDGARTEGDMSLSIPIEIDVKSSITFDGGTSVLQVGTLYEKDESGVSTQAIEVILADSDAGSTVSVTKSFDIVDQHEARIEFQYDRNPDGDNQIELNDMRLDVSAIWNGDIQNREAARTTAPLNRDKKEITSVMGAGSLDTPDAQNRVFSSAGVVAVWQGSFSGGWERHPAGDWSHPLTSNTSESLTLVEAILDAQVQPTSDPLVGWTVRQDLGAPGDITHAFDYEGDTHVPVQVKTDVLAGTRQITMYELRT